MNKLNELLVSDKINVLEGDDNFSREKIYKTLIANSYSGKKVLIVNSKNLNNGFNRNGYIRVQIRKLHRAIYNEYFDEQLYLMPFSKYLDEVFFLKKDLRDFLIVINDFSKFKNCENFLYLLEILIKYYNLKILLCTSKPINKIGKKGKTLDCNIIKITSFKEVDKYDEIILNNSNDLKYYFTKDSCFSLLKSVDNN